MASNERVPLENVLITAELARRPSRLPDHEAENRALTAFAETMVRSPNSIFQKLVETALERCRAGSAGIHFIDPNDDSGAGRWRAVAGQFTQEVGGQFLCEVNRCATTLDHKAPLLIAYPERHFHSAISIHPPIVEAMFVPVLVNDKRAGWLWPPRTRTLPRVRRRRLHPPRRRSPRSSVPSAPRARVPKDSR